MPSSVCSQTTSNDTAGTSRSLKWPSGEIPSLRGIAALSVVFYHLGIPLANGPYAVVCFFVLSGFLITHLLIVEHDRTGTVSLKRFYTRRFLRIFPAFYVYIAVDVVAHLAWRLSIHWPSVLAAATYTGNYLPLWQGTELKTMPHTWSLAVEEQFYLLWPFVFRRFARDRIALMKYLAAIILAVWLYRAVLIALHVPGIYLYSAFESRMDAPAIGCLLALANRERRLPQLTGWYWAGPAALISIMALDLANVGIATWHGTGYAILPVAFAVLLLQAVRYCRSPWCGWLDSRPVHALGVISYSLYYLYHPFASHLPLAGRIPSNAAVVACEAAFAVLIATGSYLLVERPFLRLKDKFAVRRRFDTAQTI